MVRAYDMLGKLSINPNDKLKIHVQGNQRKGAAYFSNEPSSDLYVLDEPIAGVDPAARDYILRTILPTMMRMQRF